MKLRNIVTVLALATVLLPPAARGEDAQLAPAVPAVPGAPEVLGVPGVPEGQVAPSRPEQSAGTLARENALLQEKLRALQNCSISSTELALRNCKRLKEVADEIRLQRQGMAEFQGYVKWMSDNVAGYSKYLSAGSVAAGFAKVLPIPYAGQASVFTKFVSNAAVSLSASSVAINNYLATSQKFITRADALDPAKAVNAPEVSELVRFADRDLLKEMMEVQERLASTSELSASSLSFLEMLNHYVGSTDQYWQKTKSLLKSGDDKKEKSFLAESTIALRNKAQAFNARFRSFDQTVKKSAPQIKSLVAYDELIRDIDSRLAKVTTR